jgi:hypothetical protein
MSTTYHFGRIVGLTLIAAVVCLCGTGCNEELLPQNELEIPFSMYGVISPQLDTQSVRIYPVEQFLTLQDADDINEIRVVSRHHETGELRTWKDTVIVEANGQIEFIFWSAFQAEYGERYRIEAERISDGRTSYAEVRVPEPVQIRVDDPRPQGVEIDVLGDATRVASPVAEYVLTVPGREAIGYEIPYAGQEHRIDGGWRVEIELNLEREILQSWYNIDADVATGSRCEAVYLRYLYLHVLIGDEAWDPPEGIFDANVLVNPGAMSNVENGFGFIGAGYRQTAEIQLPRDVVEGACFRFWEGSGV